VTVLSWPAVVGTAINITVNTLGAVGTGDFTIVVLTKPNGNHGHIGMTVTTGHPIQQLNDSNVWFGGGDFSGFGTSNNTDWHVIGHSKTSGSNVYRWHYWNYSAGGAKTHSNGTGTHANPGTITAIKIGDCDNRGNGLIAVVAVWKRVLSDAEFDSLCTTHLSDWNALSPDALWPLNVAAASVVDATGHGNNAASVTGTISLTGSDPPSFDFSLSGTQTLTGTGIASAGAFGAGTVSSLYTITGTGIASAGAFGAGTVSSAYTITGTGVSSAEAFGAGTVTPGAVNLAGTGIASSGAFGAGTVTTGGVSLAGSGIASGEVFGAGTVTPGGVTITGSGIASAETFGAGVVSAGGSLLGGAGIASAETFGAGSLGVGPVSLAGAGIPSGGAFGQGLVGDAQAQLIFGSGIPSAGAFGHGDVTKLGKGFCDCDADLGFLVQFGRGRVSA